MYISPRIPLPCIYAHETKHPHQVMQHVIAKFILNRFSCCLKQNKKNFVSELFAYTRCLARTLHP